MALVGRDIGESRREAWLQAALLTLLCLTAGIWSAYRGTDTNWDLRNYHFYTAHAWSWGRFDFDIAPAQMQTYFNPLPSLPYYWLVTRYNDHPRIVAFAMGLPAGIYAFGLVQIAWLAALRTLGSGLPAIASAAMATLLGMTGAAVLPGIGNSMGDVAYAAPIMLALWLALRSAGMPTPRSAWRWQSMLAIGLLCGAALGLKLTNLIYAAPLGLLVLLLFGLRPAIVAGSAMVLAFIALWGPHALTLWREFGNPLFPMFNDFFRSPDYLIARLADERFLPRDWMQAVFYPFFWLRTTTSLVGELPLRDGRVAVGYVSALLLALALLRPQYALGSRGPVLLLLLFCIGAYAIWATMFGIYRYLLVIESVSGVLLLLALGPTLAGRKSAIVAIYGALGLSMIAFAVLPNWGRIRHPPSVIRFETLPIPPGAILLLTSGDPMAYVVPSLPPTVRVIGLNNNLVRPSEEHGLARRIRTTLAGHTGPIWAMGDPAITPEGVAVALAPHGLALGRCELMLSTLVREGYSFCDVRRIGG